MSRSGRSEGLRCVVMLRYGARRAMAGRRIYRLLLIARAEAGCHTSAMCRVLVVDDHPIVRKALVFYLRSRLKVECIEATNGFEALKTVSEEKPDLVILDYSMPVMNGIETA